MSEGKFKKKARLEIQTRHALRLVYGRKGGGGKPPIAGLTRFGAQMSHIFHCARLDDPYADFAMIQVEEALDSAHAELNRMDQALQSRFDALEGMAIEIGAYNNPDQIELGFANPYGYLGAMLIHRYDDIARKAMTARHVGLMTRDETDRLLHVAGTPLRALFGRAMWYAYLGITREDLKLGTALAAQAVARFGELPQDVVAGDRRPAHAPPILPQAADRGEDEPDEPELKGESKEELRQMTTEDGVV